MIRLTSMLLALVLMIGILPMRQEVCSCSATRNCGCACWQRSADGANGAGSATVTPPSSTRHACCRNSQSEDAEEGGSAPQTARHFVLRVIDGLPAQTPEFVSTLQLSRRESTALATGDLWHREPLVGPPLA